LALAALTTYYLAVSWRRWPDPLVDFGFDLYRAWRIAQGAVLYRDVDTFYGPLSQYINAAIFVVFGPGIMHLVWVNLAVFGVILVTLYCLLRRAWGPPAAFVGCAVFVSVFGFSQFVGVSAYTYAAPYTHETTHGVLVLLLLLVVLGRWLEKPDRLGAFLAGILLGLTALLKLEILFAALSLTVAAAALHRQRRREFGVRSVFTWLAGAVLPTLLFFGYFLKHLSLRDAWDGAGHAWLEFSATAALASGPVQMGFLGFDEPWANLIQHVEAVSIALMIIAAVLIPGRMADRTTGRLTYAAITVVTVAAAGGAGLWAVSWINVGRCLLGLMALYLTWCLLAVPHCRYAVSTNIRDLRVLSAVLAVALMARMMLNGRIYQYGFYQAAAAGTVLPAILLGESADWVGAQRRGRRVIMAGLLALLLGGTVTLTAQSQRMWRSKTYAVGQDADRFYAFPPEISRMAQTVHLLTQVVSQRTADRTLLVLPDGWMVNYLARRPSPLAPFIFFSMTTEQGREARLVDELARRPPDLVVVISRDLQGYGIQRYGESVGEGQLLLQWVAAHYTVLTRVSPNPADPTRFRAVVLRKNAIPDNVCPTRDS
jgi:hypothetical protein